MSDKKMDKKRLLKNFTNYLQENRYTNRSIENKMIWTGYFLNWLKDENLTLKKCSYTDLLSFVSHCRKEKMSIANINCYLRGIRKLYQYLTEKGTTNHNPALNLKLLGETERLPHDLLDRKLLEYIYENYPLETTVQKRNKVILSLLINQALCRKELDMLEPKDINLEKATIYIKRSTQGAERTLKLEANQILLFQEYLQQTREDLLQLKGKNSYKLLINTGSTDSITTSVKTLLNQLKKKYPELKSFHQIRSSVISRWTKEKPLREAQYLAGHKHIISTQRYVEANVDKLKQQLSIYHPLK